MSDKPTKIWATFKDHPSGGAPWVNAVFAETKGTEYIRSDLVDPAAILALIEKDASDE